MLSAQTSLYPARQADVFALRDYQRRAIDAVDASFEAGHRSVCLVAPTGSGKTVQGAVWLLTDTTAQGLWLVHRTELLRQAVEHLSRHVDPLDVGVIAPGFDPRPYARIQVATIQSLLARGDRPQAHRVIIDEAHHIVADDWRSLLNAYPDALTLGLTATPQRRDGRPLGDVFTDLVVAAKYSELIAADHIVPCRVFQPPEDLPGSSLACHPVDAYLRYCEGERAFVYVGSIADAEDYAEQFRDRGIPAVAVSASTRADERRSALQRFNAGTVRVLVNVYVYTEGTDCPAARAAILARSCTHVSMYLQIAGRILRPHPGKTHGVLVDLIGASAVHGLPDADRTYSLDGRGISSVSAVKQCPKCGAVFEPGPQACPMCAFAFKDLPSRTPQQIRIYDMELRQVYAGMNTPEDAKRRELDRLLAVSLERGWGLAWVVRQYRQLFEGEDRDWTRELPSERLETEFRKLRALGEERGYKPGYAPARYRETFGAWPEWRWRRRSS